MTNNPVLNPRHTHPNWLVALAAILLVLPGCFSNNKVVGGGSGSGGGGGEQSALALTDVQWGRLVDIVDKDGNRTDIDVLVRADLVLGADYSLATNPVTESETLTVLQYATGSNGFSSLVSAAKSNLPKVTLKGPNSPSPFTLIPRNAAVRLLFSTLVDDESVNADTIQFWVGTIGSKPQDGRYLVQNDEVTGIGAVIFDPTISGRQSSELGLSQNASGFPASLNTVDSNLLLRIPTDVNVFDGRPEVLKSASGRGIHARTGVINDPTTPNVDGSVNLVRSMRTGNPADPFSGFLKDDTRPNLIGLFDTTLSAVTVLTGSRRQLTYALNETACDGIYAKIGDIIEAGDGAVLIVTSTVARTTAPYIVVADLMEGTLDSLPADPSALLTTRYATTESALQTCFLSISPSPVAFPATGVDRNASITVRFDEAINAASVLSMHSMVLTAFEASATSPDPTATFREGGEFAFETVAEYLDRQRGFHLPVNSSGTMGAAEFGGRVLFGAIESADGNRQFTLKPAAGFSDPDGGGSPTYALGLRNGKDGIKDLAGNSLNFTSFVAGSDSTNPMAITCANPAGQAVKYFSIRGGSADEDNDGLPEIAGQYNIMPGVIQGRPVTRLSRTADTGNEFIGVGQPSPTPVSEPLTPMGAVVMNTYRPQDFGFGSVSSFFDEDEYNMDIEGLAWSPFNGPNDDFFPRVSLSLSHAGYMPDEVIDPLSGLPIFPNSGLKSSTPFTENILGWNKGQIETTVFDKSYAIRDINKFVSESGQNYIPWPKFTKTFTWRDTSIPQSIVGGDVASIGSPSSYVTGAGTYLPQEVPSIGSAMLCRFRCYYIGKIEPINQFNVYHLVASSPLPAFRVFSAGGIDASNGDHPVIPDNDSNSGTRPNGGWFQGSPTSPADDNVYWAQADFVVRVSRAYTHWFDLGGVLPDKGVDSVTIEPADAYALPGTAVNVEYRGAFSVTHPGNPITTPSPLTDAINAFDIYGDFNEVGGGVSTPTVWTSDLTDLEASASSQFRYLQIRFSFVGNADLSLPATLDGIGIAYDITP